MSGELDLVTMRKMAGLNQTEFWEKIGITQSGGSRYEAKERKLPEPVKHLLRLVYVEHVDVGRVKRYDIDLVTYLKAEKPSMYRMLRRQARMYFKLKAAK